MSDTEFSEPKFLGAVEIIRRTGSTQFQIRYQDDDDPTVWTAVAGHRLNSQGQPVAKGGTLRFTVGAGLTPLAAVMQLAGQLIDGGQCVHCGKATAFELSFELHPWLPMADQICWTRWDHDSGMFRRACA